MAGKKEWLRVYDELYRLYGDCTCPLKHATPFQLLAAVMLSAQCRDDRVNQVTEKLFAVAPDPAAMAVLPVERIGKFAVVTASRRPCFKDESMSHMILAASMPFSGSLPAWAARPVISAPR